MWRINVARDDDAQRARDAGHASRRGFLRGSLLAGVGGLALAIPVQIERFLGVAFDRRSGSRFEVKAGAVPKPGEPPRYIRAGRFYLVNLRPGEGGFQALRGSPRGGLVALAAKCPHRGCTLPWRDDWVFAGEQGWFRCPCHGSTFTRGGLRVFGPAPYSMATVPLTRHRDGSLTVRWQEPRRGDIDDPSRTAAEEPQLIGCPFGAAICGPSQQQ